MLKHKRSKNPDKNQKSWLMHNTPAGLGGAVSPLDPFGSYTGNPVWGGNPEQDADDI